MAKPDLALIEGGGNSEMLERLGADYATRSNLEWFAELVIEAKSRIRRADEIAADAEDKGSHDLALKALRAAHGFHLDLVKVGAALGVITGGPKGPRSITFNTVNVGDPIRGDLASQVRNNLIELHKMMGEGDISILDVEPQERVATRPKPRQTVRRADELLGGSPLRRRKAAVTENEES